MKTVSLYLFAFAMLFSLSSNAQFVSGKGGSKTNSFEKELRFIGDVRFGGVAGAGGFGLNVGCQKGLNQYLSWDIVNLEFAAPFNSPANLDFISLKTGLRAFSPTFYNDKLRLYTNLAVGYTCALSKNRIINIDFDDLEDMLDDLGSDDIREWLMRQGYSESDARNIVYGLRNNDKDAWKALSESKIQDYHGFGLTFGVGLQYNKKWLVGYTLQYETAFKTKSHFATIGYTF